MRREKGGVVEGDRLMERLAVEMGIGRMRVARGVELVVVFVKFRGGQATRWRGGVEEAIWVGDDDKNESRRGEKRRKTKNKCNKSNWLHVVNFRNLKGI